MSQSRGRLRNQLTGLVEQTVAGVRFSTQPGFVIERVTPATKTYSDIVITFDSRGRLVVSRAAGGPWPQEALTRRPRSYNDGCDRPP